MTPSAHTSAACAEGGGAGGQGWESGGWGGRPIIGREPPLFTVCLHHQSLASAADRHAAQPLTRAIQQRQRGRPVSQQLWSHVGKRAHLWERRCKRQGGLGSARRCACGTRAHLKATQPARRLLPAATRPPRRTWQHGAAPAERVSSASPKSIRRRRPEASKTAFAGLTSR